MPITGCNLLCKEIHFEWKRSSGWLESWEVLPLFAFHIWQQMVRGVIIVSSIIIIVIMIIINMKFLFSCVYLSKNLRWCCRSLLKHWCVGKSIAKYQRMNSGTFEGQFCKLLSKEATKRSSKKMNLARDKEAKITNRRRVNFDKRVPLSLGKNHLF